MSLGKAGEIKGIDDEALFLALLKLTFDTNAGVFPPKIIQQFNCYHGN